AAVDRLLADPDLRSRLALAGGEVVRGLTWDRAGERLHDHLLEYVADPGRFQQALGPDTSEDVAAPVGWVEEDPVAEVLRLDDAGRPVPRAAAVPRGGLQEEDLV